MFSLIKDLWYLWSVRVQLRQEFRRLEALRAELESVEDEVYGLAFEQDLDAHDIELCDRVQMKVPRKLALRHFERPAEMQHTHRLRQDVLTEISRVCELGEALIRAGHKRVNGGKLSRMLKGLVLGNWTFNTDQPNGLPVEASPIAEVQRHVREMEAGVAVAREAAERSLGFGTDERFESQRGKEAELRARYNIE